MALQFRTPGVAPHQVTSEPRGDHNPERSLVPGLEQRQFSDEEIKSAFDTFDLDKNRFVGAMEIRHILNLIGEHATDEEIDEMIRMCDTDGDGQVTYDEFNKLMSQPPPQPPHVALLKKKVARGPSAGSEMAGRSANLTSLNAGLGAINKSSRVTSVEILVKKLTGGLDKIKPSQIKKIYKRFQDIDTDKSGVIEYNEFIAALEMDDDPTSRQMFRVFDMDGSNSIELKEFIVVLSRYTSAAKSEKLKFAFMMYDEDGSGAIERDELINMLQASFIIEALSPAELEDRADKVFDFLGIPRDSSISYEDFLRLSSASSGLIYPVEATQHTMSDVNTNRMTPGSLATAHT